MKSIGVHGKAGNVNLKGRKVALLGCQCCEVRDLREKQIAVDLKRIEQQEYQHIIPTD